MRCTNDVRISKYSTAKNGTMFRIKFYIDMQDITNRLVLDISDKYIYFIPASILGNAVSKNSVLTSYKPVTQQLADWEGEYELHFDVASGKYYIDHTERRETCYNNVDYVSKSICRKYVIKFRKTYKVCNKVIDLMADAVDRLHHCIYNGDTNSARDILDELELIFNNIREE